MSTYRIEYSIRIMSDEGIREIEVSQYPDRPCPMHRCTDLASRREFPTWELADEYAQTLVLTHAGKIHYESNNPDKNDYLD